MGRLLGRSGVFRGPWSQPEADLLLSVLQNQKGDSIVKGKTKGLDWTAIAAQYNQGAKGLMITVGTPLAQKIGGKGKQAATQGKKPRIAMPRLPSALRLASAKFQATRQALSSVRRDLSDIESNSADDESDAEQEDDPSVHGWDDSYNPGPTDDKSPPRRDPPSPGGVRKVVTV